MPCKYCKVGQPNLCTSRYPMSYKKCMYIDQRKCPKYEEGNFWLAEQNNKPKSKTKCPKCGVTLPLCLCPIGGSPDGS